MLCLLPLLNDSAADVVGFGLVWGGGGVAGGSSVLLPWYSTDGYVYVSAFMLYVLNFDYVFVKNV